MLASPDTVRLIIAENLSRSLFGPDREELGRGARGIGMIKFTRSINLAVYRSLTSVARLRTTLLEGTLDDIS